MMAWREYSGGLSGLIWRGPPHISIYHARTQAHTSKTRHAPREAKSSWPFLMSLRVALFADLAICVVRAFGDFGGGG